MNTADHNICHIVVKVRVFLEKDNFTVVFLVQLFALTLKTSLTITSTYPLIQ